MKRFVEGTDRGQSTLFPECLDDWVDEDNPVRVIDVFVDALDLGALDFGGAASTPSSTSLTGWRAKPAPAGRGGSPNISPAWISSFSTSSATCPSLRPAANCSFI